MRRLLIAALAVATVAAPAPTAAVAATAPVARVAAPVTALAAPVPVAAPATSPRYTHLFAGKPAVTPTSCATSSRCIDVTTANPRSTARTYGADPTGATATHAAVQAALDDADRRATAAQRWTVYLPAGLYLGGAPLRVGSHTTLAGAGNGTVLLLDRRSWAAFGYGFMVAARQGDSYVLPGGDQVNTYTGVNSAVQDLTLDGNHTRFRPEDEGTPDGTVNRGGGVATGDGWRVSRVRFTNFNYFKVWVNDNNAAAPVDRGYTTVVEQNKFDNRGLDGTGTVCASAEDNVGGGGANNRVVVTRNEFDSTIAGNALDLTRGRNLQFTSNTVYPGPTVACRQHDGSVSGPQHSVYLEGIRGTRNLVAGNRLYGGAGIALQSNAGYDDAAVVDNTVNTVVRGNTIVGAADTGIVLNYTHAGAAPGAAASVPTNPGGGNTVTGNTVVGARRWGILAVVADPADQVRGDTISNNSVADACAEVCDSSGAGRFEAAGIAVASGTGAVITGNRVVDTRPVPRLQYGVTLGYTNRPIAPVAPQVSRNSTTGIFGSAVHLPAATPAPVGLTAEPAGEAATVRWNGAVAPGAAPVGVPGYKLYRGRTLVRTVTLDAEVPGALNTAPGQLRPAPEAYEGRSGTTLSAAASPALLGPSLVLTAGAAGVEAQQRTVTPVTAGQTYSVTAAFRTSGPVRPVRLAVAWFGPDGRLPTSWPSQHTASLAGPSGWTPAYLTAVAPEGATGAAVRLLVGGTEAGERHYASRVALVAGSGAESVIDAQPGAAPSYTVTATSALTLGAAVLPQESAPLRPQHDSTALAPRQ